MNKRHYEHTLPNIRGSLSNTYEENKPIYIGDKQERRCIVHYDTPSFCLYLLQVSR